MRRLSRGVSLGAGDEAPGREVFNDEKVVLVMVGLPARGKSFISHKITNFLLWLGVRADIFNVGSLRRKLTAGKQNFDFFDANNASAKQQREELAASALRSALEWLESGGEVAIFDATNTTRDRRASVLETCREFSPDVHVIFVESICNDAQVLESNFMQKVTNSPDYKEMALEDAIADLRMRIHKYESVYETIESDELSYIKLINMQSKVICNRIYGNMAHLLVPFLMSIHILDRPIYICRPAHFAKEPDSTSSRELGTLLEESASKSSLDDDGQVFSSRLKELLVRETQTGDTTAAKALKQLRVYSSTAPRAMRTIAPLGLDFRPVSALNIVDAGVFANMSVADIRDRMSSNWGDFSRDPMNYRLHGGESIGDLVRRLSSFVVEVERQRKPVLIVSHFLNLQVLYGYLLGRKVSEGLEMSIPLHTVIKLTPTQYGYKEERFDLRNTTLSDTIAKVDAAN